MNILRFSWKDFRNLREGEILPCDGVNIICGNNAQGKTNLLEGMWLFTGERSFRGAKDAELICRDAQSASLEMKFFSGEREQDAEIRVENGRRSVSLNGVLKKSCAAVIGEFRAAVFSPEHLALLSGGPSGRRNFTDAALCQIRPYCAGVIAEYNRCLAERNALLKDIPEHAELEDTLPVWDARLVRTGEKIMRFRREYLEKFSPLAAGFYSGMCGGKEELELSYEADAEDFAAALEKNRRTDLLLGHTGTGPHRDDIAVKIGGMDARAFGSQGQKRSAVIAMKLAEAELLGKDTGEPPVIFLDDVLSELDEIRRRFLMKRIGSFQVFITCCEPEMNRMPSDGRVFLMENGSPRAAEQAEG